MKTMIKRFSSLLTITFFAIVACKGQESTKNISMDNQNDKLSYSLGVNIANSLKQQGLDSIVNPSALHAAIADVVGGKDLQISEDEAKKTLEDFFKAKQEEQQAQAAAQGVENEAKGKQFLADNASKEGVVTLPSGLQYKIIKEGNGAKPGPTDKVKTHYHGTTVDGEVFDSSVERGEPISFPVNGVIKGWTEALQLMPVGSKWKLFIPSELAYGARGAGPKIGPNSTLIFDVELLDIEK